jgi:hypothetical protein
MAHSLILDFADQVLESSPIDIVELRPLKESAPQRVVEKVLSAIAVRPSKIELLSLTRSQRVWVHSVYLFGFEAADLGQKLKHFLQDSEGKFLPDPEGTLKRLHARLGDFEAVRHAQMPSGTSLSLESFVDEKIFDTEFKGEIARVQNEEMNKAITYYDRLEADLVSRLDQERERGAPLAAIEALDLKRERVRTERNVRLGNIGERFRAQFRVQAVGARILILPTYQCVLAPNAQSKARLTLSYCPVLREFLPPSCPKCGLIARDFVLNGDQYICSRPH